MVMLRRKPDVRGGRGSLPEAETASAWSLRILGQFSFGVLPADSTKAGSCLVEVPATSLKRSASSVRSINARGIRGTGGRLRIDIEAIELEPRLAGEDAARID